MFVKMGTFNYILQHIDVEENVPADILSSLPDRNKDLPDISAHMPLRSVDGVQTRSNQSKIARDLIMMAARAKDDTNYPSLISKLVEGVNPANIEEEGLKEDLEVIDTKGGQPVYQDTLLVLPRSERKRLMETAH